MEYPCILPSLSTSSVPVEIDVSFPATMVVYQANLDQVAELSPSSSQTKEEDPYVLPAWEVESSHSHDFLDDVFPSNEAILEAMSEIEQPWGELHHRLYFLPKIDRSECDNFRVIVSEKFCSSMVPLRSCIHIAEGNMANLSPTIPTNISCDPGNIEYTEQLKDF